MHLVGLRLTNWARFRGEHELELGPGVYAVVADHDGNGSLSNGRGKTAFLEAVAWLLEGGKALDKDTLNELVTNDEESMAVEGEFSNAVFVSRSKHRDDSVKLVVVVPDEAAEGGTRTLRQDDAQAELDRIVGLHVADRATTCFADQQKVGELLRMTTGASTATFESWLELEHVAEAHELAASWLAEKTAALAAADGDLATVAALEQAGGKPLAELIADAEEALARAEEDADARDGAHALSVKLRGEHQLRRELAVLESDIAEKARDRKPVDVAAAKKAVDVAEKLAQEARSRARDAQAECDRLERLLSKKFDGACPVSPGFACPAVAQIDSRELQNRAALKAARAKFDAENAVAKPLVDSWQGARNVHEAAVKTEARDVERARQLAELRARRKDPRFTGVSPLELGPDDEFPPPPGLESPGDRVKVADLERKLADLEAAKAKHAEALAKAEALRPEVVAHRLAWQVLGPECTRRRVVEGAVAEVVRDANEALAAAELDLWVEPAWGRELGKPADNCAECGAPFPASARVKACACGAARGQKVKHEFRFRVRSNTAGVSGGNRDVAGIALRAAAFRWLKARRGAGWGVALLDEPLAQLDDSNRAAMVAGVARLLGAYEQVFLTAHHRGALDAMPNRIRISGKGLDSTVEVA